MKKTNKKILSVILAILMVATTIPTFAITAFAEKPPECYCTNPNHSLHYYVTEVNETTVKEYVYTNSKFSFDSNETMSWWNNQAHITPKENTWYYLNSNHNYGECTDAAKKNLTPTDLFNKIGTTTYAAYNETTHEHCVMKTYYDKDQNIILLMNSTSAGINMEPDRFTVEKSDVAGYDVLMSGDCNTFIYFALNENGDIKKIKFKDYELSSISASDKDVDDIKAAMPNEKFYAETMKDLPGYYEAFNYKNGEFLTNGGGNIFSDTMFPITVDKLSNNTYIMWQGLSRAIIFELKDNKVSKIIYQSAYLNEYLPFNELPISKKTLYHNGDCKSVANGEHYVVLDYPQAAEIGMLFVQKYVNGKFDDSILLTTTKDFAKSLKAGDILVENKNKEEQYEICPKASFTKETTQPQTSEKETTAKTYSSKKSPATGATTMGLGTLGLGVTLLAILKKKKLND